MLAAGRLGFPATRDLILQYQEMLILVREVGRDVCLAVFCEPALNLSLLDMSLGLRLRDTSVCASPACSICREA